MKAVSYPKDNKWIDMVEQPAQEPAYQVGEIVNPYGSNIKIKQPAMTYEQGYAQAVKDLTTHATWIKGYGAGLKRGMEMVKETPHLFIKDYPKENMDVVEYALWSEEDEKRADIIGQNGNVGYEELFDEL